MSSSSFFVIIRHLYLPLVDYGFWLVVFCDNIFGLLLPVPKLIAEQFFKGSAGACVSANVIQMAHQQMTQRHQLEQALISEHFFGAVEPR